jgi:hypothetical protein
MERKIFSYDNGKGIVKADPMQVYTRLISKDIDLEDDFARVKTMARLGIDKPSQEIVSQAVEAYNRLLEAARFAFKLEAYSGDDFGESGTTDEETFLILADFSRFMELKKNSINPLATSQPSTESASSS